MWFVKPMRRLLVVFLALSLMTITWMPAQAQSTSYEYFDETGHNLTGDFLKFYRSLSEPEFIFGYPLTEQMIGKDGKTVQYFQRARFELDPSQLEGKRVHMTPLGRAADTNLPSDQIDAYNPNACRYYSETGYPICFAFLDFFDKYGGIAVFGYPISSFMYRDGLIVQYFENARFEWRPSNPSGQLVSLTDLGNFFFDEQHEDPAFKMRAKPLDNTIQPRVLSLISRAFPGKAMALSSDGQTIYVIVQDQTLLPIANATVAATVTWSSGAQELFAGLTDDHGVATLPITFTNQPFGSLIHIAIRVNSQGLTAVTTTSFRIWH
jgi:hypothetical protein